MKRTALLSLILILTTSMVLPQSLSLMFGEENVSNDTVYFSGNVSDDLLAVNIKVKNNTDKDIDVKVTKNEVYLVENTSNTFCWGSCFLPYVYTSPTSVKIEGNITDSVSFSGDYEPFGMIGTSIINYKFFNAQTDEDSVLVTIFYQVGASGVNSIERFEEINIYPNPVSDEFTIDFNSLPANSYKVRLFNSNGQLIQEMVKLSDSPQQTLILPPVSSSFAIVEISDSKGFLVRQKILIKR